MMSQDRLMKVLLAPVVSEKSTMVGEKHGQVVFHVVPDATKQEVKAAIELLFKVQVESVNFIVHCGEIDHAVSGASRKRSNGQHQGKDGSLWPFRRQAQRCA